MWWWIAAMASAATVDRLAAVVDDHPIALSEIYDLGGPFVDQRCGAATDGGRCRRQAELEVLDALIQRALMNGELTRLGLDVKSEEIERSIERVAAQYGLPDAKALRAEVEKSGTTWEDYKVQLGDQLREMKFQEQVIRPRVSITEAEVRALYSTLVGQTGAATEREIEAFAVSVPAETTAEGRAALARHLSEVIAEINAGRTDWLTTVKARDMGPYAARDGKMGTFKAGELQPALEAAVSTLQPGQVGQPVDLGAVLVVPKLVSQRSDAVEPFEKVEPQLRQKVYEQKGDDEVAQWYQQARRRAAVQILLELP
jgi:peptidyl-prolyl cis-trans isomerase SurA